jgi:hypothetical protein
MPLSEQQRISIRHHLGYLQVADAYTFVLGVPASVETTFMIEGAMDRLLEHSIPLVARLLDTLDGIECQMITDLDLLAASKIGDIEVNLKEQEQLVKRYDYWIAALSNALGSYRNPFDKRLTASGGINARVMG